MIFDANNDEKKPATKENLNFYINPCERQKKPFGNHDKNSGIKYYEFGLDKKKPKNKRTLSPKK